jgi:hypothetical protein
LGDVLHKLLKRNHSSRGLFPENCKCCVWGHICRVILPNLNVHIPRAQTLNTNKIRSAVQAQREEGGQKSKSVKPSRQVSSLSQYQKVTNIAMDWACSKHEEDNRQTSRD